jgi:HEAT repeat protein
VQSIEGLVERLIGRPEENGYVDRERALGELVEEGAEAVPALVGALEYRPCHVRWRVARALGKIGGADAIDALLRLLEDPCRWVRDEASAALRGIGAPAVGSLVESVRSGRGFDRAKTRLKTISGHAAVPPLVSLLEVGSKPERDRAREALSSIGWPAVELLVEKLYAKGRVRHSAAETLGMIGTPALELLLDVMDRCPHARPRKEAAVALGIIGDRKAVPSLIRALQPPKWNLCRAAAKALGEIGDPGAAEALVECLGYQGDYVREDAARALESIRGPEVIGALRKAKDHPSPAVRDRAEQALNRLT